MGVPCSRCGREYDVALFAFGRTIHCTCGQRVGVAPRVRETASAGVPRFAADAMLGRLARWLRILGFDTAHDPHWTDEKLVRRALQEERAILTRDRALPEEWRVSQLRVLAAEEPLAQLREVDRHFGLRQRARLFSRCSRCNAPLVAAAPAALAGRVPERVARERRRFTACPGCRRVYWEGSHTERMRRRLERELGPLS